MSASASAKSRMDRILRLHEEIDELKSDIRDIYAEEKSDGGDKTAMGAAISYIRKRRKNEEAFDEREALAAVYLNAYQSGTRVATHTHAREASVRSNSPSPAIAPSPQAIAGDEPQTSSAPSFPDPLSNEVDDGRPLPSANVPSAQNAAVPLSAVGQGGVTPGQSSDEFAQQSASAPQVRNEAESESGVSVSHFTNPRCERPDTCPNAHSKETCFDCTMAWAKRPAKEQVMLWQQAVEASRTQAA